jgi:hypothetical protein
MRVDEQLFCTMGVELTWLYPKALSEEQWISGYSSLLSALFREKKFKHWGVLNDGGALEISTPPFLTFQQLSRYYSRLMTYIEQMNTVSKVLTGQNRDLVYSRSDTVSGGGHIHVGFPRHMSRNAAFLAGFLTNLFRDVQNRPYLNWVFNDPGDVKSAENFFYLKEAYYRSSRWDKPKPSPDCWKESKFLQFVFFDNPVFPQEWTAQDVYSVFDISKGSAVKTSRPYNGKPWTMEFRFFDAKWNLEEIRLHVEFLDTYLRYIEKKTLKGSLVRTVIHTKEDIAVLGAKGRALKQFKSFMEEIGLDYGNYHQFVERNYRKREEAGLLR